MAPGAITATTGVMEASLEGLDALFWADHKPPTGLQIGLRARSFYRHLLRN
jgi:hypothetical protein